MKVLFLTHRRETPSTRYRVTLLLPFLKKAGQASSLREIESGLFDRLGLLKAAGRCDVVVVQKKLFSRPVMAALRKRAPRLVYDFDDAVGLGRDGESQTRRKRFAAMVSSADLTIAGNPTLADSAREAGARRVEILPTSLDPEIYPVHDHGNEAVLGWIGGGGNLPYLEQILPSVAEAATKDPRLRLRIICDRFPRSSPIEFEKRPWSEKSEARDVAGLDIGLAPLPDDPWTRGKCGFKILQYMAAGVPVVASPVGVQSTIVEQGRTGFLASTQGDWTNSILRLAGDPALRARFGAASRRKVESEYSSRVIGRRLSDLLQSL